jgi:hypothetical protein
MNKLLEKYPLSESYKEKGEFPFSDNYDELKECADELIKYIVEKKQCDFMPEPFRSTEITKYDKLIKSTQDSIECLKSIICQYEELFMNPFIKDSKSNNFSDDCHPDL